MIILAEPVAAKTIKGWKHFDCLSSFRRSTNGRKPTTRTPRRRDGKKLKLSLAFKNRPLSTGAGKAVGGEPSSPSVPKTTKIGTFLRREETERGQQVRSIDVETANRQREKKWKKVEATYRERDEPQAAKATPKEKAARTRLSTRMSRLKVETRDEAEEEDTTHAMMQFGSAKHLKAKAVKEEFF